jgi:hypothetical protein
MKLIMKVAKIYIYRRNNSLTGRENKFAAQHSVNFISWFIHIVPYIRITALTKYS